MLRQKDDLTALADAAHRTLGSLSPVELITLEPHILKLWKVLSPAWERLNWNSLVIDEFVAKANRALDAFKSLLERIHKVTVKIERIAAELGAARLFGGFRVKRHHLLDCKVCMDQYPKSWIGKV